MTCRLAFRRISLFIKGEVAIVTHQYACVARIVGPR
jgi:hypothetical protein